MRCQFSVKTTIQTRFFLKNTEGSKNAAFQYRNIQYPNIKLLSTAFFESFDQASDFVTRRTLQRADNIFRRRLEQADDFADEFLA